MIPLTNTVKHLIIINVIMFVGALSIGFQGDVFNNLFALYFPANDAFKPWQLITHMFMHANYVPTPDGGTTIYFAHILFNMFGLWMFGGEVERIFGRKKFIFFYISAGLGAALLQLGYYYLNYLPSQSFLIESGIPKDEIIQMISSNNVSRNITETQMSELQNMFNYFHSSMVGASGALMGILVAFGMLFPDRHLMLIFLPIPIKAKYFIPGIIGLDLISAITGASFFSPSNTAYVAHVGGALTGFLMMYFWKKNQFDKYRWN